MKTAWMALGFLIGGHAGILGTQRVLAWLNRWMDRLNDEIGR